MWVSISGKGGKGFVTLQEGMARCFHLLTLHARTRTENQAHIRILPSPYSCHSGTFFLLLFPELVLELELLVLLLFCVTITLFPPLFELFFFFFPELELLELLLELLALLLLVDLDFLGNSSAVGVWVCECVSA